MCSLSPSRISFYTGNINHLPYKIVGTCPDAMAVYLYYDGSPELLEMVKKSFGDAILTNAYQSPAGYP